MNNYLLNHAITNVWCTPEQDKQFIFQPARLTPNGGARGTFPHSLSTYTLPNDTDRFHVYMIGAFDKRFFNIIGNVNQWYPFPKMCKNNAIFIDAYYQEGIHYPLHLCWCMRTMNGNHLIAVKINKTNFPSLDTNPLHFRFYSNSYFGTIRNTDDGELDEIRVSGKTIDNQDDIVEMTNRYAATIQRRGHTLGFVNGYYVDRISPITIKVGDVVEIIRDSTMYEVIEFDGNQLDQFDSTLDNTRKYIIPGINVVTDTIEYQDDVEVYLYIDEGISKKGVYYHRNAVDAMRMLTHKDWAIVVPYVSAYVSSNPFLAAVGVNAIKIKVVLRHSGYRRKLVNEHHRIKELYKLAPEQIKEAMTGLHSNIVEWTGDSLESSAYVAIMRALQRNITLDMVVDAYGYNAISKLIGDTPTNVGSIGGTKVVYVPPVAVTNASIWEYDADGLLTSIGQHGDNDYYPIKVPSTAFCEVIIGKGGFVIDDAQDDTNVMVNASYDYRYYKCPRVNGIPNNEWIDVTGSNDYGIVNGKVVWGINLGLWSTLVRNDNSVLAYEFDIDTQDGLLFFNVEAQYKIASTLQRDIVYVPHMRLEVWLNGKALVKDVDYITRYPAVTIINKKFRNPGERQHIAVRAYGLAPIDDDNKPYNEEIVESGFVDYGVVSRNGVFNLRDDKVMRYVVGGRVYRHEDLPFMEDKPGMVNVSALNNLPYMVYDHYVPLRDFVPVSTSTVIERNRSKDLDSRVSAYLTVKLPEEVPDIPSLSEQYYQLFSPFMCKVIHLLRTNEITPTDINPLPTNDVIESLLEDHFHWLAYDPTRNGLERDNVDLVPHPYFTNVEVTSLQYRFLLRINTVYFQDKLIMDRFINIVD